MGMRAPVTALAKLQRGAVIGVVKSQPRHGVTLGVNDPSCDRHFSRTQARSFKNPSGPAGGVHAEQGRFQHGPPAAAAEAVGRHEHPSVAHAGKARQRALRQQGRLAAQHLRGLHVRGVQREEREVFGIRQPLLEQVSRTAHLDIAGERADRGYDEPVVQPEQLADLVAGDIHRARVGIALQRHDHQQAASFAAGDKGDARAVRRQGRVGQIRLLSKHDSQARDRFSRTAGSSGRDRHEPGGKANQTKADSGHVTTPRHDYTPVWRALCVSLS